MESDTGSADLNEIDELEKDERRRAKRRYKTDRRIIERRKKYWWMIIFPILIGVCATALISWGAYITHVTYTISANYETNFVAHISARAKKDAIIEDKVETLRKDYTQKLGTLRTEMNEGLKEIRDTNLAIYNLLLQHEGGIKPKPIPEAKPEFVPGRQEHR